MKRILLNILLAFTIIPLGMVVLESLQFLGYLEIDPHRVYLEGEVLSDHLRRYIMFRPGDKFFVTPFVGLFTLLIPYNLILIHFFLKKRRYLSLLQKCLLFFVIEVAVLVVIAMFGFGIGLLFNPKIFLFVIYFSILSLLCVTPLHYWVDKDELLGDGQSSQVL